MLAGLPQVVPAHAADTYRGQLYCETFKSLAAIADIVDFEISLTGKQASYSYVPSGRIAAEVALLDSGAGTAMDGQIEMAGGASTKVWHLQSRYSGRMSQSRITLTGVQTLQGGGLTGPITRTCDAVLTPRP